MGDAENLPFEEASFDLVTCRFAAHHFPDLKKAVGEIARVLKPGGIFLLVDHYAPEETELDVFVNQLNRLRDPSHVRESSLSEWQDLLTQHGLFYREIMKWDLPIQFQSWVERSGTPYEVREKLVQMLKTASLLCQASFRITFAEDGNPRSFCLKAVLLHGVK
ncbi:class I SAM-dependent methyltransferase [Polycladomyces subterraneus]|uniref:Methyltransferase domain-containing protein n=1 Tax=Polycladomyces subterraneus TaxID=1016997 RepID=A0ABT8IRG9_9BACL|nr:class I SAM-dependent methyltransferase [Polycladomyces subterraneus]MDN4595404.1 methyltransferase domain-containing protein [Polycladomyces subterraneus]